MEGFNELIIKERLFYHKPMQLTGAMKLSHRLIKYAAPLLEGMQDKEINLALVKDFFESFDEDDMIKTVKDVLKMSSAMSENKTVVNLDALDVSSMMTVMELTYKLCEVNLKPFLEELWSKLPKAPAAPAAQSNLQS